MSTISSITSSNSLPQNQPERTVGNSLDQEAFLQILVTQLRNQDPLNPQDDTEFIGQMAQFSVLEQMQMLNSQTALSSAAALIGKTVSALMTDSQGQTYSLAGTVSSVLTQDGQPYLLVNHDYIPYSSIRSVSEPVAPTATEEI